MDKKIDNLLMTGARTDTSVYRSGSDMVLNDTEGALSFVVPSLVSCDTIDTDIEGRMSCGVDGGASGSDFTFTTNYGSTVAATSSPLWLQDTLYASSTSVFEGLATFQNATTTLLTISGLANCNTIDTDANGFLSCGTDATGTGGAGAISTSTSPTIGNLAYWTSKDAWPETLGTVATTSLTASAPLSLSQPISVIGGTASALSLSVAGDWTGTIDGNNFDGGAIGAGDILYGSGAGTIAEIGIGASSTVLVSNGATPFYQKIMFGESNHTITLAGNPALASHQCYWGANGIVCEGATANTYETLLTFTDPTADRTITFPNSSITVAGIASAMTGTFDGNNFAGGAIGTGELLYGGSAGSLSELAVSTNGYILSLNNGIPAWVSTSTLITATEIDTFGELQALVADKTLCNEEDVCAIDADWVNTANPWADNEVADTITAKNFTNGLAMAFNYATSTAWTGTTTKLLAPALANITVGGVYCETDTGTVGVSLYDGANRANYIATASTTKNWFTYSTNNTFTAGESIRVDFGTPASSPTQVSCRWKYLYD